MRKRKLGNSDIEVSELALGTWGLSGDGYGPVPEEEKDAVLDRALDLGINLFETADCYGRGAMETKLGERLPKDTFVITKLGTDRASKPPRKRFDSEFLRESFERSRERLRRDVVDVVLLHNPVADTMHQGEAAAVLDEWRTAGEIRMWGVSAGSAEVARAAMATEPRPQLVQLAYNIFFSHDVAEIEPAQTQHQVGLLARSVLAHGLLTGFWNQQRKFGRDDHRRERWTPEQLERRLFELSAVRTGLHTGVTTLRSVALRFVLDNARVNSAILGPKDAVQLDQLVREAGTEPPYLPPDVKQRVVRRLGDLGVGR